MKRWWQGHNVEELLLVVIAMACVALLILGVLHIALVQHPIVYGR